jgi:hypothetical protein
MEGDGMTNVSKKPVKWQDDADGWHVGYTVDEPSGHPVGCGWLALIRETPCGTLSWVDVGRLTDYVVTPEFK